MLVNGIVEFGFSNNLQSGMYTASVLEQNSMLASDTVTLDCSAISQNDTCYGYLTAPVSANPIYFSLSNVDGSNLIEKTVVVPTTQLTVKQDPTEQRQKQHN